LALPELDEPCEEDFEIFKSNAPVISAFFALGGCAWKHTGMGDLVGLDYTAADIIWRYQGIKLTKEQFSGLMLFSSEIVNIINKRKEK
jgi:hypothetical protein